MDNGLSITDAAQAYLSAGLCTLPAIRAEKRPAVGRWKQYQRRLPTPAELSAWMANNPDAVCILCGAASNNAEIIDFDGGGELFSAWCERIPAELRDRLVIERTPSGGWHVIYHCIAAICGNLKLAQRRVGEKVVTLIETRGEGGLFLCAPTAGYEITQGDPCHLPVLTEDERDVLLQVAWDLNEYLPPVMNGPTHSCGVAHMCDCPSDNGHGRPMSVDISHICGFSADDTDIQHGASDNAHSGPISADHSHSRPMSADNADRPGDDFNLRGDVRAVLQQHGWERIKGGDNEYWRRPDKSSGTSATLKDRVFYVFSSNAAPFEPNTGYSPFSVYTLLEHGGDFEQAARSLRTMGFGGDCSTDNRRGANMSATVRQADQCLADHADDGLPAIRCLKDLLDSFTGLHPPIIHGLLREGETMNIIAAPKMGKSWFAINLATCIASGLDWMGQTVEHGRVLHIDNELHDSLLRSRYRTVSDALGLPYHLYGHNIDMVSLRGCLRDLYAMGSLFARVTPGQYKLVIIDAFYRTLPRDTDENDNGAVANLYNRIDYYAAQMKCAFVLIHHTSKGNQSGKAVTDVGAGAGSQSRAADTHLVLRPHEEDHVVVLESAVRSWPPMEPRALHWHWPLFTPTDEVDASVLLGASKPGKAKAIPLADFVEQCIAINDPCSKRSVCYEANQRLDLSERKAEDLLELAMERGLAARVRIKSSMQYVKNRPGASGEKGLWTAALLAHDPTANAQDIADVVGATRQYVNQVRRSAFGNSLETGGN